MIQELSSAARLEIAAEEDSFRGIEFGIKSRLEWVDKYRLWSSIKRKEYEQEKLDRFREKGNE
jgi:hypothetical protein